MAPGHISQEIHVRGLPTGVKMYVTEVNFKIPSGDWWPVYLGPHDSITKNTSEEQKKKLLPFEITKDHRDGYLGTADLGSTSVFDTGSGPEIYLTFKLQGTTSIDGQDVDLGRTHGFVTISSTEWGFSRPDYCNITYQVMGQPPRNLANSLPALQSPKDVSFIIGASPKEDTVGINATVDPDVTKDLIGYALKGIFYAHEKAAGWVIGKV